MAGDDDKPPYATRPGGAAGTAGGCSRLRSSCRIRRGEEFDLAYLKYEFFFEQLVEV